MPATPTTKTKITKAIIQRIQKTVAIIPKILPATAIPSGYTFICRHVFR
jgi:hypothetical protein